LSRQAIEILKNLKELTGNARYAFPSQRSDDKPMSDDAINDTIDTMGYTGEMVGHGVRTMFISSMNEQNFKADAIERQLAHKEKNAIHDAYNSAKYLPERICMMQHWLIIWMAYAKVLILCHYIAIGRRNCKMHQYRYSSTMKQPMLRVVFYASGEDKPLRDWLLKLEARQRKEIGADIQAVNGAGLYPNRWWMALAAACTK